MGPLSLELFQILDAIDRRGSFAAAAEELNRVPSALSYTVQKHEEQLALSLFQREGRRSVFTPAGRLLLNQGREILGAVSALGDEARTLANGWEPRIRLAVDSLISMDEVMSVLRTFLDRYPLIEVDVSEEVLGGTWEALLDDRVDLLVGGPAPRPRGQGLRAESIGAVERVCAVSPEHPLAQIPRPVDGKTLSQYRAVIVHDSSRRAIPRSTRLFDNTRRFYVQTIAQKVAAQKAGIGVGFLPRRMIQNELDRGELVALPVSGVEMMDHLYLAWRLSNKGQGLKRLVAALLEADLVG